MTTERARYTPTYLPDGRKAYNPSRSMRDIHDEWDALEDQVRRDDPNCQFPDMQARELWRREEATAERWKEWQQRVWLPRCRASSAPGPITFTTDELAHMVETWKDANDPVSRQIAEKAAKML